MILENISSISKQFMFNTYGEVFKDRINGIVNCDINLYDKGVLNNYVIPRSIKRLYRKLDITRRMYILCFDIAHNKDKFGVREDVYQYAIHYLAQCVKYRNDKKVNDYLFAKNTKPSKEVQTNDITLTSVLVRDYDIKNIEWLNTRADINGCYRCCKNRKGTRLIYSFEEYQNAKDFVASVNKKCICEHSPFLWVKRNETNGEEYETI